MSDNVDDVLKGIVTIKVGGDEVKIDPTLFDFDHDSLTNYLQREAGWYSYFGAKFADADAEYQMIEAKYDATYCEKFALLKESEGGSDKLVECKVKQDAEIQTLNKMKIAAKRRMKMLQQHLRAWDKNHDNAQQLGYIIRKELGVWSTSDIYEEKKSASSMPSDEELDKIIGSGDAGT
jgi:hypothetical protein